MGLIEVTDLAHTYAEDSPQARVALRGVSFSVTEGEYLSVVGANGSGKSTLALHLNGLLLPTSGSVRVAGLDTRSTKNLPAVRRTIAMVFQRPEDQIVALTVEEDTAFGPENARLPRAEIRRRVSRSLEAVGLAGFEQRSPHRLSAGQKQRLAVAGALALEPRAIVFDEATSMLDPRGRSEMLALMEELNRRGVTIVHVTHRMDEAAASRRIIVLRDGCIALDGTPAAVFASGDAALEAVGVPPALELALAVEARRPVGLGRPLTFAALGAALREKGFDAARATRDAPPAVGRRAVAAALIEVRDLEHTYGRDAAPRGSGSRLRGRETARGRAAATRGASLRGAALATGGDAAGDSVTSLRGVSLSVPRGAAVVVLGSTGSGKSTLLQHLDGLFRPQRGSVVVDGTPIDDATPDIAGIRRRIALAFQRPEDQLFSQYVGDEIAFGPRQAGLGGKALTARVRRAMELVGLPFEEYKDRQTFALSGGEQRKVGLAGVLALEPEALLLDEPTAGLDPLARRRTLELLDRLHAAGMTLVTTTHDMDESAQLADRIVALSDGSVRFDGEPGDVFSRADGLRAVGLDVPHAVAMLQALAGGVTLPISYPMRLRTIAELIAKGLGDEQ